MILLLGGTSDARLLLSLIAESLPGTDVLATAVSEHGAALLAGVGYGRVRQGALDFGSLVDIIRGQGIKAVVDATHPYATRVTAEAKWASAQAGIAYLRFERPEIPLGEQEGIHTVTEIKEAAALSAALGDVIFLAIGTRGLADFMAALPPGKRVTARVLPEAESLYRCREAGLGPAEIVAAQGPFSRSLNVAMFREYKAEVLVTKDSGAAGGTPEKLAAAAELGLPVVLLKRPPAAGGFNTPEELLAELKKILRGPSPYHHGLTG